MAYLKWISDKNLIQIVSDVLDKAKDAKKSAASKFGRNVIDPFASLFEISGFDLGYNNWKTGETARQAQKTLQNHIGEFHQKILGSCTGWKDLQKGNVVDLVSGSNKIIAEIKNKYNTLSGGKLADLYHMFDSLVSLKSSIYKGYTA